MTVITATFRDLTKDDPAKLSSLIMLCDSFLVSNCGTFHIIMILSALGNLSADDT